MDDGIKTQGAVVSGEGAVNLSTHRLCCLSRNLQMKKKGRMLLPLKRLEQPTKKT